MDIEELSKKIIKNNEKSILFDFKEQIRTYRNCLEKQHDIILLFCSHVNFEYKVDDYPILKGIVYKNTINLYSALELIKKGYHSSAAILLRNVFEGFLIVLQIVRFDDYELYKGFYNDDTINPHSRITNNDKIPLEIKQEIKYLWRLLCKKNHATTSSMQISIDYNLKTSKDSINNKKLTSHIMGIFGLFVDINWVLTDNYIFDPYCNLIIEENYKENGLLNKFTYKYKIADTFSKKYRVLYSDHSNRLINYLEEYSSPIKLKDFFGMHIVK